LLKRSEATENFPRKAESLSSLLRSTTGLLGVRFTAVPVFWEVRAIPEIFTVKESKEMPAGTEAGTVLNVKLIGREPLPPPPPVLPLGKPLQESRARHAARPRKTKNL
jgi:hypothetical protein